MVALAAGGFGLLLFVKTIERPSEEYFIHQSFGNEASENSKYTSTLKANATSNSASIDEKPATMPPTSAASVIQGALERSTNFMDSDELLLSRSASSNGLNHSIYSGNEAITPTVDSVVGQENIKMVAPPNDLFPGNLFEAIVFVESDAEGTSISASPSDETGGMGDVGLVIQSTKNAGLEPWEQQPCGVGATVWYHFMPSEKTLLRASTKGSDFDTVLAIYQKNETDGPQLVTCLDNFPGAKYSEIAFQGKTDVNYYFQVGGARGESGVLKFRLDVLTPALVVRENALGQEELTPERHHELFGSLNPFEVLGDPGCADEYDLSNGNVIAFAELYRCNPDFDMKFSNKLVDLQGQKVKISGYMAPALKPEMESFGLTRVPVNACPFCSSAADWPDDIVWIKMPEGKPARYVDQRIEVEGRLDIGELRDEDGFVSLVRICAEKIEKLN
jgi:hypothetical protein